MPDFIPNAVKGGNDERLIDTTEIFSVDLDSFFRQTSGEYDFMFDDVVRAQNRISGCLRSGDTKAVKEMIFGMLKEEHLDISEVQPYLNRVENFEKMKGISGKKTRTQEKTSIREQLNDGKTKKNDTPHKNSSKKNDLEV